MNISLKDFFLSLSSLLDFLEMEMLDKPTNHGKRVAYLALCIGKEILLSEEDRFVLGSLALLHDLGASEASLIQKMKDSGEIDIETIPNHTESGAELVSKMPYIGEYSDVILYHHERYDGRGLFDLTGSEIPLFSRIIYIADQIEILLNKQKLTFVEVIDIMNKRKGLHYDPILTEAAINLLQDDQTDQNLCDSQVFNGVSSLYPDFVHMVDDEALIVLAESFSHIVDAKSPFTRNHSSGLAEKARKLCIYYGFDAKKTTRLAIAALLHDIGKLSVSNDILEKNGKLTDGEFQIIRMHPLYTREALSKIKGWEDITEWASDHHEKLNGKGYPLNKNSDSLSFESKLLAVLDIFQALSEERPYKKGFSQKKITEILLHCSEIGELDGKIVDNVIQCLTRYEK